MSSVDKIIGKAGEPMRGGAMVKAELVYLDYKAPCPLWQEMVFMMTKPEGVKEKPLEIIMTSTPKSKKEDSFFHPV